MAVLAAVSQAIRLNEAGSTNMADYAKESGAELTHDMTFEQSLDSLADHHKFLASQAEYNGHA